MMSFLGRIPGSKSLINRALIIQSYFSELNIVGDSDCDDVLKLRSGLEDLKASRTIECGDGGTVFRFLALRASRIPGRHVLTGSARLMSRPHEELIRIFHQLSVKANFTGRELILETEGWHPQGDTLGVPSHRSSQFVSSVLLNAWDLPFDLFVSPIGAGISEGYWRMTQKLVSALGMKMETWDHDFRVPAGQKISSNFAVIEPDMSSAFAVAAAAAVAGSATLMEFPRESLQPDFSFVSILSKMGVPISFQKDLLKVQKAPKLNGVAVKLSNSPDLFPVLATLCALAEGDSELYGAPQLVYKESNRIEKIKELLRVTGRDLEVMPDGIKISGKLDLSKEPFEFDPDHDHRLAMAASLLHLAGAHLKLRDANVVTKSYPGYWQAIGWQP
jgi:3-phosphoshikimate 1-carboxyvinyltransferase